MNHASYMSNVELLLARLDQLERAIKAHNLNAPVSVTLSETRITYEARRHPLLAPVDTLEQARNETLEQLRRETLKRIHAIHEEEHL